MSDQRPYRGYIFISSEKSGKLALALAQTQQGTMAPSNTWVNAHKRAVDNLKARPNMFTVDGMRSIHMVLSYGKFKQHNGGIQFEDWAVFRQDSLRWIEAGVTEVMEVTKHNNKTPVKNTAGPHTSGVPNLL